MSSIGINNTRFAEEHDRMLSPLTTPSKAGLIACRSQCCQGATAQDQPPGSTCRANAGFAARG